MSKIERIKCGNGNCFLVEEEDNAILVDTSRIKYKDMILEKCKGHNVRLIVLTHGHVDHIQNAAYLSRKLNAPIAMHKADFELTKNNMLEPLSAHTLPGKYMFYPTKSMLYGDRIKMEKSALKISNLKNVTVHFGHGKSMIL